MPLPLLIPLSSLGLALAIAQLGIGLFSLWMVRRLTQGEAWLLTTRSLERPGFTLTNTLGFAAANVFLILPAFVLYLGLSATLGLRHLTAGFLTFGSDGIYAEERIYKQADQTIHLIATIHLADPHYYEEILASVPPAGSVVLAEGVSDREALLERKLSYEKLGRALSLAVQPVELFDSEYEVKSADVDVRDFSPQTIEMLNTAAGIFQSETSLEATAAYYRAAEGFSDATALMQLWDDIVRLRNEHLLEEIARHAERYPRVVVPWGAAHMPGLERALLDQGFKRTETHRRRIIGFPGSSQPNLRRS